MALPTAKYWALNLGLAAVCFITGKLGLMAASVHPSVTPISPPTGVAIAALLLLGYRFWPGVFFGAFFLHLTTATSLPTSLGIAAGNALEALCAAYLVNRDANGRFFSERVQDIFRFAFLAGIASPVVSATIGVTSLSLGGYAGWEDFGRIWFTWWLGDLGGALVIAPLLILWSLNPRLRWMPEQYLEAGLLVLSLLLVGEVVFVGVSLAEKNYPLDFLFLPIIVWSAFRFSPRETVTAIFLISFLALWGTLNGLGPFVWETANESLLLLGAFMSAISVTGLALAATVREWKRAEQEVVEFNRELERRVGERTVELYEKTALYRDADRRLVDEAGERRKVEESLHFSEERYSRLIEAAPEIISTVSVDGIITSLNPAFEIITGWPRGEWIGRHFSPLGHPEELDTVKRVIVSVKREKKPAVSEARVRTKSGEYRHMECTVTPELRGGEVVGFLCIARDITERKRAEDFLRRAHEELEFRVRERTADLARANDALKAEIQDRLRIEERLQQYTAELESFSYSLAHDLRSPLLSISGLAQILIKDYGSHLEPAARDYMKRIIVHTEHMDQLIKDLLAYSRLGRDDLKLQLTSLQSVVSNALSQLEAEIGASQAQVEVKQPLPPVLGDPVTLTQVISNLLTNAVKFVPPGVVPKVTVWADERNHSVRLWVEDNGIGIPAEHQRRIFHVFERLHSSDTYPGTGIGLAIVARGIERLGGQKGVESEEGKGSRFWIKLPRHDGK